MIECKYCRASVPNEDRAIIEGWFPPPDWMNNGLGPVCPKCVARLFAWNEETEEWEKKGN